MAVMGGGVPSPVENGIIILEQRRRKAVFHSKAALIKARRQAFLGPPYTNKSYGKRHGTPRGQSDNLSAFHTSCQFSLGVTSFFQSTHNPILLLFHQMP